MKVSVNTIVRDISVASAGVATAISAGLLSGTAERWTTGALAVMTAMVAAFTKPQIQTPNITT